MGESYFRLVRFRKPAVRPYPNVCACIGTEIGIFHDRKWWHATGPARYQFSLVEVEIADQLNSGFTERYSSILLFHLYMIGHSRELAVPTIMFFCEDKKPRRMAKKIVDEGGLLKKLPAFRTGDSAKQPSVGKLIQPASGGEAAQSLSGPEMVSDVYFDPSHPVKAIGMPIFVKQADNTLRRATANAVFDGETYVYLTASHVFFDDALSLPARSVTCDSECDFGSETESEFEGDLMEVTSRASISSSEDHFHDHLTSATNKSLSATPISTTASGDSRSNRDQDPIRIDTVDTIHTTPTAQRHASDQITRQALPAYENLEYLGTMQRHCLELDWALIRIRDSKLSIKVAELKGSSRKEIDLWQPVPKTRDAKVIAHTSRGPTSGQLSQSPTYMRLPNSTKFQQLYEVSLDSALEWGDCGASVSDAHTEEHYGHVVVSSSTKQIAYIVPGIEVARTSATQWNIPTKSPSVRPGLIDAKETADPACPSCEVEFMPDYYALVKSVFEQDDMWLSGWGTLVPHLVSAPSWSWWFSEPNSQSSDNDALRRISVANLGSFKSKHNMQAIRLRAVRPKLENELSGTASLTSGRPRKERKTIKSRTDEGSSLPFLSKKSIIIPAMAHAVLHLDVGSVPPPGWLTKSLKPSQAVVRKHSSSVFVEKLIHDHLRHFMTCGMSEQWISKIVQTPITFLSALYVASSFTDAIHNQGLESIETLSCLEQLSHFGRNVLAKPETCATDPVILSTLHVIAGHFMAGKDASIGVYMSILELMIQVRGSLDQVDGMLISMTSLVALEIAIFDERQPKAMYLDYCAARQMRTYALAQTIPESPLYRPHGKYFTLKRSLQCNVQARKLLKDAYNVINILLDPMRPLSNKRIIGIDNKIVGYSPIEWLRQKKVLKIEDWRCEAIRICSVILSTAIMLRITLSSLPTFPGAPARKHLYTQFDTEPLRVPQDFSKRSSFGNSGFPSTHISSSSSTTRYSMPSLASSASSLSTHSSEARDDWVGHLPILSDLKEALENSDLSECWGDMAGVLLWIGLTAGAASRRCLDRPLQRYFSALAMRASLMLSFEHPEAIRTTLLRMTAVNEALGKASENGKFLRNDAFVSRKRRKV